MNPRFMSFLLGAAVLSTACAATAADAPKAAHAVLHDRDGKEVARAVLIGSPHGVLIAADFTGLPAGDHAFHIHETGECEPPFKSAGGHFNPEGKQHGLRNPKGFHAGDLPNIHVKKDCDLNVEVFAPGVKLGALLEGDGSALVVHAGRDDYTTDPAGAAGDRIACGVIMK
jgi:Cu-Zn family superoxide dismutase